LRWMNNLERLMELPIWLAACESRRTESARSFVRDLALSVAYWC
jgi:hypothetical protein